MKAPIILSTIILVLFSMTIHAQGNFVPFILLKLK